MATCGGIGSIIPKQEPISRTASGTNPVNSLQEANNDAELESGQVRPQASSSSVSGASGQALIFKQSLMVSIRAACLLFPLYGLHYLLIIYRPKTE